MKKLAGLISLITVLSMFPVMNFSALADTNGVCETFDSMNSTEGGAVTSAFQYVQGTKGVTGVEKVSGVFGKAADDVSAKMYVNSAETLSNTNQVMFTDELGKSVTWEYGQKIKFSMNLAFDSTQWGTFKTNQLQISLASKVGDKNSSNEGLGGILLADTNGNFTIGCRGGGRDNKGSNFVPKKWYNFEFIIEPGNGKDVKNKITSYIDGVYINTKEFDADNNTVFSKVDGVSRIRFDQYSTAKLPSGNYADFTTYVDDVRMEMVNDAPASNFVTVTAAEDINTSYKDVLLISNNETIADMKEKVNVTGGSYAYVDSNGIALDDTDKAADSYLKIIANNGSTYTYLVTDSVLLYGESFNGALTSSNGYGALQRNTVTTAATTTSIKSIGGKSAKALVSEYTRAASVSGDLDTINMSPAEPGVGTNADVNTIEFSLYNGNEYASAGNAINITFNYKRADGLLGYCGELVCIGALSNNEICAGNIWNEEQKVVLGKAEKNRWYKFDVVINKDLTFDIYVNGELKADDVKLITDANTLANGVGFSSLRRIKYGAWTSSASEAQSGVYGIADLGVYAGNRAGNILKSLDGLKSEEYNVDFAGIIAVNSDEQNLDKNTFLNNLSVNAGTQVKLFDDATYSGSDSIDKVGIQEGNIVVTETSNGTVNYYVVLDAAFEDVTVTLKNSAGNEIAESEALEADTYTATASFVNYFNKTDVVMYLALYDENNVLVEVVPTKNTISVGGMLSATIDLSDKELSKGAHMKALLWNDSMQPIIPSKQWIY